MTAICSVDLSSEYCTAYSTDF